MQQLSLFETHTPPPLPSKPAGKRQAVRAYQEVAISGNEQWPGILGSWGNGSTFPLLVMATGGGKALAINTPILTPVGLRPIHDISVGDFVIGSDGCPTEVIGVYPQGIRPAYKITFSDGVSVVCDGDHLWSVRTKYDKYHNENRGAGEYRVMTTKQLMNSNLSAGEGNRWFIPIVQPIQFKKAELPLDPYLLGLLIGDGYIAGSIPAISTADDEILKSVESLLPAGAYLKHQSAYDWRLTTGKKGRGKKNPVTEALRELGLWGTKSHTKFVPSIYLYNSIENRLRLLRGLMDSDGYISERPRMSFSTTSLQLAEDMRFLIQSLGGIAKMGTKKTTHKLAYRLNISLPDEIVPFQLKRKRDRWKPRKKYLPSRSIVSIEPCGQEKMVCLAVNAPDSLFVIEHAIVTHNTTVMAEIVRRKLEAHQNARFLIFAHTEEIVFQIRDRIVNQTEGHYSVGIVMNTFNDIAAQIVVATRQSLHEKRLHELLTYAPFDYVIIDEGHHATADNTYGEIVSTLKIMNPMIKGLGATATPKRSDGKGLGTLYSGIAYEWMIPDGIKAGVLVPIVRHKIATQVDLSGVKSSRGDYQQNKMVSILKASNWVDLATKAYIDHIHKGGRKALAFFPSVEMSETFATALLTHGVKAVHVDGTTPKEDRRAIIRKMLSQELDCVSNFGVFTEGLDLPAVDAIFLARPTRERGLFTQIVGRGIRSFPGKQNCLLVDLTVRDTKALDTASLLGKMIACSHCGAEFMYGLTHCPLCGEEVPRRLDVVYCQCGLQYPRSLDRCPNCGMLKPVGFGAGGEAGSPDRPFEGSEVVNYQNLFEGTFAAWYHGPDGLFSCSASFDEGAFVIQPPIQDDDYRLLFVPKNSRAKVVERERDNDLLNLMLKADEIVQSSEQFKHLKKDAEWREQQASLKQVDFLKTLGISVPEEISRGEASSLITHALAVARVR